MKKLSKILTVAASIALWVIILIAALFAFTTLATRKTDSVANIAGYTPMVVKTESMAPTFNAGDLIIIKTCDTSKLQVGDSITFHTIIMNEYALNTHRIQDIVDMGSARSYTTKGDNNAVADTHIISDGDIVGKYQFRIPGMGKVMDFLSSSTGFLIVIVLPMLAFFIYQIYHLVVVGINLKKAIALEAAQEAAQAVDDSASAKMAEAEAALAEARRMKAEAEEQMRKLQESKKESTEEDN